MYDAPDAARTPLILTVDADPATRALARKALEKEGYAIAEARDGREALDQFQRVDPSLVLIDSDISDGKGVEICAWLREQHADRMVPIVLMASSEDRRTVDQAYAAGATDFIEKPVLWMRAAQRIRYLLRANRVAAGARRSRSSMATAQRLAHIGSWELDTRSNDMYWSDEIFRIFGLEPNVVPASHREFWNRVHPADLQLARARAAEALAVAKSYSIEHRIVLPDGSLRHVQHHGEISGETGAEQWMIGTLQDVTEQKAAQERILHLASYDSLTGLANRHLFLERLDRATQAARKKNHLVGLLYLDLDKFKRINDTLGHAAGDTLLRKVAELLLQNVRGSDLVCRVEPESDPEVSRLGGDEFTILLTKIQSATDAGDVARRILAALPEPIRIGGHEVSPTGSMGIAIFPMDGSNGDTILKNADTAMYHAKDLGRNNFQFYNESMNKASIRKLTLEGQLRRAIEDGTLELAYQPRLQLATRRVTGMEALLRWQHPELGRVAPSEIIPLAEETGLIVPLGRWVLEQACAQSRAWQEEGYENVLLSVNVSSRQFAHHDLFETISEALKKSGLDPHHLEIEITESLLLQDDENTALTLRDLRAMGVRVALDDFGTGYSSLSYLTRFPLDTVKMDRCFVRDIDTDHSAAGIAAAVISMVHSLGATVVAEGVDAEEQARMLTERGCDDFQGFLFSPAVAPADFPRFLRKRTS